jgi:iron(III) transport system permease protein
LRKVPADYGEAGAYALILVVVTVVAAYFYWRMTTYGKRYQTVTGKGFRPRTFALGRLRWVGVALVGLYFFCAIVAPTLILVYASTQTFYSAPTAESLSNMSFANYERVLSSPGLWDAIRNSVLLAAGTATTLMFLMAVAAWLVTRTAVRGRWIIDALAFAPIALPGVVVGVALIFIYLRSPLPVYGTLVILYVAYLTRFMPFGMRYAVSAIHPISAELEEASATAGGRWWQTFRRIVLPLLVPGLLSGWIFVVIAVLRELSSSLLLYSPGNEVLSVVIWGQWIDGFFGALAATGIVMILILVGLVLLSILIARLFQGQSRMRVM